MKYILLVLMIDNQGNEHIDRVNNIVYKDKLHCLADKAYHSQDSIIESTDKVTQSITYFCANELLYKPSMNNPAKQHIVYYNESNNKFYGK